MNTNITSEGKILIDTFISENLETITNSLSQMGAVRIDTKFGMAHIYSPYRYTAYLDCSNGIIKFGQINDNVYFKTLLSIKTNCNGTVCNKYMRRKCCFRYFINQIKSIINNVNTKTSW